jgi:hypothetical protein
LALRLQIEKNPGRLSSGSAVGLALWFGVMAQNQMKNTNSTEQFPIMFRRWARRVRQRVTSRYVLSGMAVGLVAGALTAGVCWKLGKGSWRPWTATVGALGALAGGVVAYRRRWRDDEVALYLDGRLGTLEVVTTALELGTSEDREDPTRAVVLNQAVSALQKGDPKQVRPPVFQLWHAAIPVAGALIGYVAWIPLPPKAAIVAPPGSDKVTLAEIQGLEKVEALAKLTARDDEQRKRLDKIAADAKKLREKLRKGMERREALDEIARMQDALQAERLSLGDGERRQGLEAALAQLAKNSITKDAAKALADKDLVKFDEEMAKIANQREKSDREKAKKALEDAIKAAQANGAKDVAKALEKQKELLEQRGKRADLLKELGKSLNDSLSEEQRKQMGDTLNGRPKDDKDARKMAKAMEDALKKLSPEERKRLAERLKKQLKEQGDSLDPQMQQDLGEMAKNLDTEEGRKKLAEELKRMANESDDEESERQKGLDGAQKGLGQMQKKMGAVPVPMGGSPGGKPGGQPGGNGNKPGKGGPGSGGGVGDHKGSTKELTAEELRSRAKTKVHKGAPNKGITIGRTAGKSGDSANVKGTGELGKVGPGEVKGVDKSEVPEEYREHVGRYFQP